MYIIYIYTYISSIYLYIYIGSVLRGISIYSWFSLVRLSVVSAVVSAVVQCFCSDSECSQCFSLVLLCLSECSQCCSLVLLFLSEQNPTRECSSGLVYCLYIQTHIQTRRHAPIRAKSRQAIWKHTACRFFFLDTHSLQIILLFRNTLPADYITLDQNRLD